jgi:hypothetical protein
MARLTTEERGSLALANLALFFTAYLGYLFYLLIGSFSDALPTGSLQAQQGQQLQQIVNSSASALDLSSVSIVIVFAGIIILAIFLFFRFSTGRYQEVYN